MPTKAKKAPTKTTKQVKKKPTKAKAAQVSTTKRVYKSKGQYDNSRNLAIGGLIGLLISYFTITRALNTGSYWEYLFGLIFLILAIRLFIRSIQLK